MCQNDDVQSSKNGTEYEMRRAARVDSNAQEIVEGLRKAGAYVRVITQGDGLPDLLVGYKGHTLLIEIKDGNKPPSAQKLTAAEQKFFDEWPGGPLVKVNSLDEAITLLQARQQLQQASILNQFARDTRIGAEVDNARTKVPQ
jgi:Holliday junction resolvase